MKRRAVRIVLVLVLMGMAGASESMAAGISDEVRAHWKHTREMMLAIAAAAPEDKYDFKPVPEVRSFREMLHHMVTDTHLHIGYVGGVSREENDRLTAKYAKARTRAELLKGIEDAYDYGDKILADLNDQNALDIVSGMRGQRMTRIAAYMHALHDIIDHYGNLVVYLRLNGITPPSTATRQQQRQQEQQHQEHHQPGQQH
jgi:uncharacterized damage-inducible protein DinB